MLFGDQWSHIRLSVGGGSDFQRFNARLQRFHQLVGYRIADRYGHRNRHATLAGRSVSSTHQRIDCLVDIGVGHYHHMVLCAAKGLNPLIVCGSGVVDIFGDWGRSDKGYRLDVLVGQNRIDDFLVTMHHIENAGRQSGFDE